MCAHVYITLGGPNVPTRIVKREITYIARTIQWPGEGNWLINILNYVVFFFENVKEQKVLCDG